MTTIDLLIHLPDADYGHSDRPFDDAARMGRALPVLDAHSASIGAASGSRCRAFRGSAEEEMLAYAVLLQFSSAVVASVQSSPGSKLRQRRPCMRVAQPLLPRLFTPSGTTRYLNKSPLHS